MKSKDQKYKEAVERNFTNWVERFKERYSAYPSADVAKTYDKDVTAEIFMHLLGVKQKDEKYKKLIKEELLKRKDIILKYHKKIKEQQEKVKK